MRSGGMDLLEKQQRMTALMNSMTAAKTAGELQGVSANLENLSTLLKARLERKRSSQPDTSPQAPSQEGSFRTDLLKSTSKFSGVESSDVLKDYVSGLIFKSLQSKWSAQRNPAAKSVTSRGLAARFQSVFTNPVFPPERQINKGVWNKIADSLPGGYQIPNPRTYGVITNSLRR
ncbi:hypothetical protein CEF21_13445 [Bacillus sp. FJAT-42376]|uniref:hypothetical protein n=1 Tax=Bacillus sp. FJAT-42376 TaxID=2014076 RepID=UPI000F4F1548|nr:hypothetical protein [Bacillus sp. FJAT-42376]AZB43227.1 hypothetical protein CEF21_13445 [Bacillus sp. FJAT-42376]